MKNYYVIACFGQRYSLSPKGENAKISNVHCSNNIFFAVQTVAKKKC
jgi:hypothetical protein